MTSDTLKSLGYLKKSLKMTKRAIEKNMGADNTSSNDVDTIKDAMAKLMDQIDVWEAMSTPVPSGVMQPPRTNISPIIQLVAQKDEDDLLIDP